jgi:hypothetical protein
MIASQGINVTLRRRNLDATSTKILLNGKVEIVPRNAAAGTLHGRRVL